MKHKEMHQRDFQWAEIDDRPKGAAGLNSQVKRSALTFKCFSRLPFKPAVSYAQSLCEDLQGVLWSSFRSQALQSAEGNGTTALHNHGVPNSHRKCFSVGHGLKKPNLVEMEYFSKHTA